MRNTLICTVGTSLLRPEERTAPPAVDVLLARLKACSGPDQRQAGAEANAVADLVRRGVLDAPHMLHLCVSDTTPGRAVGSALAQYLQEAFGFAHARVHVVDELADADLARFERGLEHLVGLLARLVRQARQRDGDAVFNATGGYKAVIALAGLVGQLLGCPVYYLFEAFPACVRLPALPMEMARTQWEPFLPLLEALTQAASPPDTAFSLDSLWQQAVEQRLVGMPDGRAQLLPLGELVLTLLSAKEAKP